MKQLPKGGCGIYSNKSTYKDPVVYPTRESIFGLQLKSELLRSGVDKEKVERIIEEYNIIEKQAWKRVFLSLIVWCVTMGVMITILYIMKVV